MELERGKIYIVKHSSGIIHARFVAERELPGYVTRFGTRLSNRRTHFVFQSLKTGRDIEVKSMLKIRGLAALQS